MKTIFSIQLGGQQLQIYLDESHYLHRYQWNTQRHCHAQYEMHILLRGSGGVEVNDQKADLHQGQGVLFVPGEYHHPKAAEGNIYRFSLSFMPKTQPLADALSKNVPTSRVFDADNRFMQICTEIFQEFATGNSYKQSLLTILAVKLLRLLGVEQKPESGGDVLPEFRQISLIDEFFENHYARKDGEKDLARMLNISRRQLIRVLDKNYGMTYRQKLICARMDRAAWLLRNKALPISQIAGLVGYTSDSSFYQAFLRHFHVTPSRYRKNHQKEEGNAAQHMLSGKEL